MIIGIPKEIKNHEYRVGMTPEAVQQTRLSRTSGDSANERRHRFGDRR